MTRIASVFLSVAVAIAIGICPLAAAASTPAPERPNIILFLLDDISTHELGCYGNRQVATPHIDQLAQEGIVFQSAWATPQCVPTRTELMSGQYGFLNGAYENAIEDKKLIARMPVKQKPLSRALQETGYRTFMGGKWHIPGRPWDKAWGFDEQYLYGSLSHPLDPSWIEKYTGTYWNWANPGEKSPVDKLEHSPSATWHPMIIDNGTFLPTTDDDFGPEMLNNAVLSFLDRRAKEPGPFFVYYAEQLPHVPWDLMKDLRTGKTTSVGMVSNVEAIDQLVERLVRKLKESGLYENTIILLAGDNPTYGLGKSAAGAIGAHIPLIVSGGKKWVRWNGSTPCLMDFTDFYPTFLDYAGVPAATRPDLNGTSFRPLLDGNENYSRPWIFSYAGPHRVVRNRDWCLEDDRLWACNGSGNPFAFTPVVSETPESRTARSELEAVLRDLPAPSNALLAETETGQAYLARGPNRSWQSRWVRSAETYRKTGVEELLANPLRKTMSLHKAE